MTDKIFFHPETGKPLHRVPVGATIPAGTAFGYIRSSGDRCWGTLDEDYRVKRYSNPHFTVDPIPAPMPPLPTETGSLIRATDADGDTCEVMAAGDDQ